MFGRSAGVRRTSGATACLDFLTTGMLVQGARVVAIFAAARDDVASCLEAGWTHGASGQLTIVSFLARPGG
ncbi:hypothetical protein SAMN05216338_103830 [Bradyrhizobium sp. Rc2d]|nr:hypothetical protein SAMN05216338_103830 [Bradyrhizobium sp. Rc2d]